MKKLALSGIFLAVMSVNAMAQDDTDTTITTTTTSTPVITTTPVSTPVLTTTPVAINPTVPVVERRVIVTPTPAISADKITPIPAGYANCFNVAAGWYNDIWVAAHQVCQYKQTETTAVITGNSTNTSIGGSTWVAGYWACPKYNTSGECTSWVWKPGRWVKTLEVY
jgi:hypothetical protein